MKMKKLICMSVAVVMAVGMLAGCGEKKISTSDAAQNFSETDEKLTLKWLGYPRNPGANEGGAAETAIEERFNVEIEPLFYEENKFNDKKTMLMAGGEIPDLVYELDPVNVYNDVDQDFIVELPYETIQKYAPKFFDYLNSYAPAAWIYSRYEDANWGIPNFNHAHMVSKSALYREDWLEALNLEVPKTLDELHTVLLAMTNNDPDGNGKKDTWGMSSAGSQQSFFSEIFGAYDILPFDWQEVGGEIVYGGVREEVKDVLTILAQWYKEGIIHPDFFTGGKAADIQSGQIGYQIYEGAYFDKDDAKAIPNAIKAVDPDAKIALGFLPEGPEGKAGARAWGRACHVVSFGNTEGYGVKVPRMLQIFEAMHTDEEFATNVRIGKEGEQWEKAPEDTTKENNFQMLPGYETSDETRLAGLSTDFRGATFFAPIPVPYDTYMSKRSENYKAWLNEWTDEKYALTNYFFKTDVCPSSSDYLVDLQTKQQAYMSEIIQGIKPIDAYDEFIELWNTAGGQILTEEANELKGELDGIYADIGIK